MFETITLGPPDHFFNNASVSSDFLNFLTQVKTLKESLKESLKELVRNLSSNSDKRKNAEKVLTWCFKHQKSKVGYLIDLRNVYYLTYIIRTPSLKKAATSFFSLTTKLSQTVVQ